jgi:hypothetical protein
MLDGNASAGKGEPHRSREQETVAAMIRIYCEGQHGAAAALCPECESLRQYALGRLERCPFGEDKPVCAKCRIHCYKPAMRERIKAVMAYAGPKMMLRHPLLALGHLWDKRRIAP